MHDVFLLSTAVDCGTLPNPVNGQVNTTGTTLGQTATYSCNRGYNLVGDSTRTCQATGAWSGSAPTCQGTYVVNEWYQLSSKVCVHDVFLLSTAVDCGTLPDPVNGQVNTTGTTLGQTATYSCNRGYNLVGDSTRTCQATGAWSGSALTCQGTYVVIEWYQLSSKVCVHDVFLLSTAVDCGTLPDPVNGQVNTTGTTLGQTATYSCNRGYNLVGDSTRTCQATGAWSGSAPTCQGTYVVIEWYQLSSKVCVHDVFLLSTAVDCGTLPDPVNGQVNTTGTTLGQTATYSCNRGYNLVGDSTRTCQATGAWSGSAPTCQGTYIVIEWYQLSSKVCVHDVFLLSTAVDCGTLPDPVNGQVNTTGTTLGQTATYSCNRGYNLVGDSTRTCQATGAWSGSAPTCQGTYIVIEWYQLSSKVCVHDVFLLSTAVDCGTLPDPVNGQVNTTGTTLGQTATYSCNRGYNLVGDSTRTCQATGAWSGSAPTCQSTYVVIEWYQLSNKVCVHDVFLLSTAVECGTLPNPVNGQVNTTGTTLGQTATYSCNRGYNLVGDSTRTCQATGAWSGSAPTCRGVLLSYRQGECMCSALGVSVVRGSALYITLAATSSMSQ